MQRLTNHHKDREQGFTLVEVMIATAIMTMMITLVWASFSLTIESKKRGEDISDRFHQVRLTMQRMVREMSMAYLSKNDYELTLNQNIQNSRTRFIAKRNNPVDEVTFSSFSHMRLSDSAKECDQTLITYFSAPDPENRSQLNLMRRSTRRLGVEKPGEEGPAYIMLEDVESLHFEFYDAVSDEWRENWTTIQADGQQDRLPLKIRIYLTMKDASGDSITFRTATRTHLLDPLWFKAD